MKRRIIFGFLIFVIVLASVGFYLQWRQHRQSDGIILFGNVDVRQVDLGFRVSGRVVDMPFDEGDFIKRGQFIGKLDDQPYADQVKQAKANYDSIKVNLNNAEILLKRREQLIKNGSISQEDLDNAKASHEALNANLAQAEASIGVAMTNLDDTIIYAPNDGTILTRIREPGTVVRAADAIYTLSVTSPIWIRAFVPEPLLGIVYYGMQAEIFTDSQPNKPYVGHIGFISPVAEFTPKTVETTNLRTDLVYRLRIIAENPDQGLLQGMPVTVKIRR